MYITPVIPSTTEIKLDINILKKAEAVVIESAKLTGGHNKYFIDAIKELLRITNSYYSNRIDDIKDRYEYMFQQEKRNFEVELKNKTLEIQIEEREKHYIKVDENSLNGKLLEKTLELMEKKGGKNEK